MSLQPVEIMTQLRSGDATTEVKLSALEQAKEFPVSYGIDIFTMLYEDEDENVKNAAIEAANEVPEENFANYILMEDVTGEKLDKLSHIFTKKRAILEAVILNPTAKDDTIKYLAATSDSSQLELILIDRIRLQRVPSIYDDMLANPRLTTALKHQVDREKGGGLSMYDQQGTPREVPKLLLTGKVEDKIDGVIAETEKIIEGEGKKESVYKQVMTMTIPEKIQFALKGPKEGRALLIRDTNKIVSASVLKSPKVNDMEVENFAKLRNVSEEILRGISMNRQWMRKMGIVDALAKNPKTPVPVAMKLLPRLNKFSLKAIASSRDVPAPVSKLADKLYKKE